MRTTVALPALLRLETADLHREVEEAVGLPGSVRSRPDYSALLVCLLGFHAMIEQRWAAPQWRQQWSGVNIDLNQHLRAPQLMSDLAALGVTASHSQAPAIEFGGFAELLGSLYVVEGSALGGQVLAPLLRGAAGDVPTSFFESAGRDHPKPWRAVKAALTAFEETGGDGTLVIEGARATFDAFGTHVASAAWSGRQ